MKRILSILLCVVVALSVLPRKADAFTVLKNGSSGENVIQVQQWLKELDYPVSVDGKYGSGTAKYVTQFQKSKKLTADGKVGTATWNALKKAAEGSTDSGYKKEAFPLEKGMQGSNVKKAQKVLVAHGLLKSADGKFGSGTQTAVKKYQKMHNLPQDGKVGTDTWASMIGTKKAFIDPEATKLPIKKGASGSDVKLIQQALINHGYSLKKDGKFGSGLEKIVKKYQKAHSLKADGIVGGGTWDSLISSIKLPAPNYPAAKVNYSENRFPVAKGSSSGDIKKVQKALAAQGYEVKANGKWNEATANGVKALQEKKGMKVTGKVDLAFWKEFVATQTDKENIELLARIIKRESNTTNDAQRAVATVVISYAKLADRSIQAELKSGRYSPTKNWEKFMATKPTRANYENAEKAYYCQLNPFGDVTPLYFHAKSWRPARGSWWTKLDRLGNLGDNVYYAK